MEFDNLHQILRSLYEQMMPLCADMAGVAKGIAGLGALFYVAYRVWQSLARAEPIDVFPMLRPFAVGLGPSFGETFPFLFRFSSVCFSIADAKVDTFFELANISLEKFS